jgi:hypothetical protein
MTPGRPGPRVPQQRAGTQPSSQDAWIWRAHSCKLWLCPWMLPDSRGTIQNPMAKAGSPAGSRAEQAGAGAYDCITQDPERNEPVARGWCCLGRRVSLPLGVGEPVVTHVRRQTDRQAHTHTHTHTTHRLHSGGSWAVRQHGSKKCWCHLAGCKLTGSWELVVGWACCEDLLNPQPRQQKKAQPSEVVYDTTCLLRWDLVNLFLSGLSSNHDPPDIQFLSSWDYYWCMPPCPARNGDCTVELTEHYFFVVVGIKPMASPC